jgi:hypothetical protein
MCWFTAGNSISGQDTSPKFRVVMVKGKPLRSDKSKLRDGQQLQLKESVWFTSLQDVVILMNDKFEKIYAKPKDNRDLAKLVPVKKYLVQPNEGDSRNRGGNIGLRGTEKIRQWQSVDDSLKLNMVQDLEIKALKPDHQFVLYDRFMEPIPNSIRWVGEDLVIKPLKLGLYFVFQETSGKGAKQLAEVEFVEKNEIRLELKFVAQNAQPKDSAEVLQVKYLKGMYPHLPPYQLQTIIQKVEKH